MPPLPAQFGIPVNALKIRARNVAAMTLSQNGAPSFGAQEQPCGVDRERESFLRFRLELRDGGL